MKFPPTTFWGKLSHDGEWHPLADHSADVAACLERLLAQPVIRRRLARLGEQDDLSEVQVQRLSAIAAFHDVGKFNLGFQNKAWPDRRPVAGHVGEAMALLLSGYPEERRLCAAMRCELLESWFAEPGSLAELLAASIAHHGRPVAFHEGQPNADLWRAKGGLDPIAGVQQLAADIEGWFPRAFQAEAGSDLLPAAHPFQHAFSGLVTLADWLGSDRRFFPFSERIDGSRMDVARLAARDALKHLGLDVAPAVLALANSSFDFERVFGFPPRPAQERVLSLSAAPGGSLAILEAETGSGKTEAALSHYVRLFSQGLVGGMYFALPTRTAATQIHDRVARAIATIFPEERCRPPVVLAVPGYLRVDEAEGRHLPDFGVLWPDFDAERWRFRTWAAENPKRFLAGAISVGTIDQVLLSALPVRHAHLRAASLLRQLLVVDEVHASDTYMVHLLEVTLRRHLAAGGHAFLMSATLGSWARERFAGLLVESRALTLEEAVRVPYPAITWCESGRRSVVAASPPGNPKTITVDREPIASDASAIASLALAAARRGARVIVVRNTVADAIATQESLEAAAGPKAPELFRCFGRPAPHHSRFSRSDRVALDRALEECFRARRGCGTVVVATQTVQQSLDLDADFLLTDLCPVDVLLQRLGRLHRHVAPPGLPGGEGRPEGFSAARAVLLTPAERDLGSLIGAQGFANGAHGIGRVYEDLRVLEATWRLMERYPCLEIPQMNRQLVEEATHPHVLADLVAELGGRWHQHAIALHGVRASHARLADWQAETVDWAKPFCDTRFGDLERRATTRLGEDDRRIVFEPALPGPFGGAVHELTLPAWLARGADSAAQPEAVVKGDGGFGFQLGSRHFVYDRLGLRPTAPLQEDDFADA